MAASSRPAGEGAASRAFAYYRRSALARLKHALHRLVGVVEGHVRLVLAHGQHRLQADGRLHEQHALAVEDPAALLARCRHERRLTVPIDHIKDHLARCQNGGVEGGGIAEVHTERRGIDDDIGVQGNSGYGIGFARGGVRTAIENNYFGTFKYKIIQNADRTGEKDSVFFAKIYAQGNSKELDDSIVVIPKANKTGLPLSQHLVENPPFAIPYEYALEDAEGLNASLPGRVGSKVVTEVRVKGKAYKN